MVGNILNVNFVEKRRKKYFRISVAIGVLILVVSCFFSSILSFFTGLENPVSSGEFGDQFGVLNTIFSGFAFTAFIYAIYLQRLDLEQQRMELQQQREEMQRATTEQEEQSKIYKNDSLRQEFYQRINLINVLKQQCLIIYNGVSYKGEECIRVLAENASRLSKCFINNDINSARFDCTYLFTASKSYDSWVNSVYILVMDLIEYDNNELCGKYINILINNLSINDLLIIYLSIQVGVNNAICNKHIINNNAIKIITMAYIERMYNNDYDDGIIMYTNEFREAYATISNINPASQFWSDAMNKMGENLEKIRKDMSLNKCKQFADHPLAGGFSL